MHGQGLICRDILRLGGGILRQQCLTHICQVVISYVQPGVYRYHTPAERRRPSMHVDICAGLSCHPHDEAVGRGHRYRNQNNYHITVFQECQSV